MYNHVGYIPDDDSHTSFHASAGYQFINWFGLGMGYGAFTEIDTEPESFSGLSLEYRILAGKKWLARANFGFALNYNLPTHSEGELAPVDGSYPFLNCMLGIGSINILRWVLACSICQK